MIKEDTTVPEKTTTVRVKAPYRVVHETNTYTDGDQLSGPEDVAHDWLRFGWVEHAAKATARDK